MNSAIIRAKKFLSGGVMIPIEIKEEVRQIIENYNKRVIGPSYIIHFQEANLFLFRCYDGRINLYARLAFQGEISNWDCYFYSKETNKYEQFNLCDEDHTLKYVLEFGLKSLAS